jgi:hypothetical protein
LAGAKSLLKGLGVGVGSPPKEEASSEQNDNWRPVLPSRPPACNAFVKRGKCNNAKIKDTRICYWDPNLGSKLLEHY